MCYGTTQCDDGIIKCERKNRVPSNATKVQLEVMLVLPNAIMKLLNVRKKKQDTIKCDKSKVGCNVDTAQCEDRTVKCEEKSNLVQQVTYQ